MFKTLTPDHGPLPGPCLERGREGECPTILRRIACAAFNIRRLISQRDWTRCSSSPRFHAHLSHQQRSPAQGRVLCRRRGLGRIWPIALPLAIVAACAGGQALAQTTKQLAGSRLIEEGLTCAGRKFGVDGTAARYDEFACKRGDWPSLTAKVRWLSADELLLVESNEAGPAPERPPRVWLFRIESVSTRRVQLRETWIGWGAGGDSRSIFRRTQ